MCMTAALRTFISWLAYDLTCAGCAKRSCAPQVCDGRAHEMSPPGAARTCRSAMGWEADLAKGPDGAPSVNFKHPILNFHCCDPFGLCTRFASRLTCQPNCLELGRFLMGVLRIATAFTVAVLSFSSVAMAAERSLVPFGEFIASVAAAQSVPRVEGAVAGASAFAAMKSYIMELYADVDAKAVRHSFVDANDT